MDYEPVPLVSREAIEGGVDRQREYYNYNHEKGPVYIGEDSEVFFFNLLSPSHAYYFHSLNWQLQASSVPLGVEIFYIIC